MNIEQIPERLMKWCVILVGLVLALALGQQVGNGKFGTIALVMLAMGIGGLALAIPSRIWMIVPIAWPFAGQIPALGIPATVRDLIVVSVFGVMLVLIAFKVVRSNSKVSTLDILVGLTVFYLIAAFIRNPVGVAALDSDRVGGRPYFNVMISFLAYWILTRSIMVQKASKTFPLTLTYARAAEGLVAQILAWAPALAVFLSSYYTSPVFSWAFDPNATTVEPGAESTQRLGYLAFAGMPLATYALTVYRPFTCLNPLNFGRSFLFSLGVVCILLSGFRTAIIGLGGFAILASYFHGGKAEVWRMVGLGVVAAIFLALGQGTVFNLPRSAQRALSFLPGKWDTYALEEAQESTRWRVEMWKDMLLTNKYIENKMFGDGFGFKRIDLERIGAKRAMGINADQEDFMTTGGVHSGPVSTIRYAGYVGLLLHLLLLGYAARFAWQTLRRAKATIWQPLIYLLCIPVVIEPFFFVFIFGSYENSVIDTFFAIGMMQMLKSSMDEAGMPELTLNVSVPALPDFEPSAKRGVIAKS